MKVIRKVLSYEVPVLEDKHARLFAGDRNKYSEYNCVRCRHQGKICEAEARVDAIPQIQFHRDRE